MINLRKMASDEDYHSDSGFYYPEEDDPGTSSWAFNANEDESSSRNEQIDNNVDIQKYI